MPGYKNRVIKIDFPDLSEPGDPVYVIIRNPQLMPPAELRSYAAKFSPDLGNIASDDPAALAAAAAKVSDGDLDAAYGMFARMVLAWRVYDASAVPEINEAGDVTGDQPLLPLPATPELVSRLPLEIIERLGEELGKASPRTSRAVTTTTT